MQIIAAAALAGLLATPHCAAMCGGFATACARPRAGLGAWHAGRLATYAALGAIAGAFGNIVPGPAWLPALLAAALLAWFAAGLAGLTPHRLTRVPLLTRSGAALARRGGLLSRLGLGLITGLLPCGMVYAALSLAVAAGSPQVGALAMLAFGAATVPGLSLLSLTLQRVALRSMRTRRAVAALILLLGLWSLSVRAFDGTSGHRHGAAGQEGVARGHTH
jgi:sulfite exporter TauE/SafE